jgi:hypothetical protein
VWELHSACINHTRECHIKTHTCQNYSRVSRNHTLRVEINHVLFKITLVRVGITLYLVVLGIEITLVSVIFTRIRVKLNLVCVETTRRVKSHSPCGNRTLRVEINLVHVEINLLRVEITFVRVEITLVSVIITLIRVKITFACRNHSCAC